MSGFSLVVGCGLLLSLVSAHIFAADIVDEQQNGVDLVKRAINYVKVDRIHFEPGVFLEDKKFSGDVWMHGSVSARKSFGAWEFALGARADAYHQFGMSDFLTAGVDYTENYLRWNGDNVRMTVGTQNILWGRVDEVSQIDRLSRVDLSRIILDSYPDRRRAVFGVRAESNIAEYKVDVVWLPIFDAAKLPHSESVWNPVDTVNGRLLGVGNVPMIKGVQVQDESSGSGGAGVRLTHTGGKLDYGLSLQRVKQSQPYYRVVQNGLLGVHPFSWVASGELEMQGEAAIWRMEAVWSSDVPVTTQSFQFMSAPALDVVVGAEFSSDDGVARSTLQLAGHKLLGDVLVLDRDRVVNLNGELEYLFSQGRWRSNFRFVLGLNERDIYLNPKLAYLGVDRHEIFVAAHLFSGAAQTLGGYYDRNDLAVLGWQVKF